VWDDVWQASIASAGVAIFTETEKIEIECWQQEISKRGNVIGFLTHRSNDFSKNSSSHHLISASVGFTRW
jgi:hypothetical protein